VVGWQEGINHIINLSNFCERCHDLLKMSAKVWLVHYLFYLSVVYYHYAYTCAIKKNGILDSLVPQKRLFQEILNIYEKIQIQSYSNIFPNLINI
jgi:hypothetical protein